MSDTLARSGSANADSDASNLETASTLASSAVTGQTLGRTVVKGDSRAGPTQLSLVGRSTVLPHVEPSGQLVSLGRERFEQVSVLGEGGMGVVELVNDHDMHRSIAIKRLSHGTQPDLVRRFVAEIRTVAQLEHPNIVPVHDVGLDANGGFFFIMKHVKGDTLEGLIARLQSGHAAAHQRWTFNARARLFLGVLNAVAYAHERGVLHRDLKPANIMVGEYGEVTVMDWGIACAIPPVKAGSSQPIDPTLLPREPDTHHVGTPLYMSPEQARKENSALDQRSDVYSLGVVLHELLFLEHYLPPGQGLDAVLAGVQQVKPATQKHEVEKGQASVPAELGWFIARAMAKNPADRYQTVHEMRDELERVLAGKFRVQCQRTAFKRALYELMAFSERYPKTSIIGSTVLMSVLLMGAVEALLRVF